MTQLTWDDITGNPREAGDPPFPQEPGPRHPHDPGNPEPPIPPGYSGRPLDPEHGCPWCLAPPSEFHTRENALGVSCSRCECLLPVDAEWFQKGDKIVTLPQAARLFQCADE